MSEPTRMTDDAIVWRADAEDGGSVWIHANGEWGHEGGSMSWAMDAMAVKLAADARASEAEKDKIIKALVDALAGILREEPNIYEGRLEASLYVTMDALDAAQAALAKAGRKT